MPSTEGSRPSTVTDGVLVLYKEAGWTSHDVVAKVRALLGGMKVGHGGTLDPAATGVLPILVGRATRVAEYLLEWDKEYHAVLRLGETTDTQDATGVVLTRAAVGDVKAEAIRDVVARFRGPRRQVPPMYSAVKVGGRPLYKAARAGETLARRARPITIHAIDVLALEGRDVTLRVVCSKGTYIRTLCADIGEALGVGAHLASLERRRVGPLSLDEALTVEQVSNCLVAGALSQRVLPLNLVLAGLPSVTVSDEEARRVLHGAPVTPSGLDALRAAVEPATVRLQDVRGRLLAIGTYDARRSGPVTINKVLVDSASFN